MFSVKTGTVMEGSKLSCRVWEIAIYLFAANIKGGIPAPLDPNRPTPGRMVTRKVDSARARVQRACRMAQALGLPQIGCDEAEAILDLPGQPGAR